MVKVARIDEKRQELSVYSLNGKVKRTRT